MEDDKKPEAPETPSNEPSRPPRPSPVDMKRVMEGRALEQRTATVIGNLMLENMKAKMMIDQQKGEIELLKAEIEKLHIKLAKAS